MKQLTITLHLENRNDFDKLFAILEKFDFDYNNINKSLTIEILFDFVSEILILTNNLNKEKINYILTSSLTGY